MIQTLIKIGLSRKEAKVYLATLELGQDTVQNIAKKAEINRPTAYTILKSLMKKGLATSFEQSKKTYFVAEDPIELDHLLDQKQNEINERRAELESVKNQIHALNNARNNKPIVKYFEGVEGLMALENYGRDRLEKNYETNSIAPIDLIEQLFPEKRKEAVSKRVESGVKSKTIYTHKNHAIKSDTNREELRQGIWIPRDKFPIDATISIYPAMGIKIFYFNKKNPYGVLIESKELARNFQLFFDLAWEGAKKQVETSSGV